jgi:ABC-type polysaccharide/polyol phosphate transport system ATPase subunit
MLYDLWQERVRCVQLVDFSALPVRIPQLRGISLAGERLYALSPSAMLIFRMAHKTGGRPNLILEKSICRPEWVAGNNAQGNLHAIFACPERERIYLSFNAQSAIDIFDLDGNFLQRRHLWDIAPGLFTLPRGPVVKDFHFGIVRHIFENEHQQLMLTAALLNGTKDSAVINLDTGQAALQMPAQSLNGGLVYKNRLYLCAARMGEIISFAWPIKQEAPDTEPTRRLAPLMTNPVWQVGEQITRGMAITNDRLVCGVRCPGRPKPNQIPPRLVEFDLRTGEPIREHWLPSFQGFEEPEIYALLPLTEELARIFAGPDAPRFFNGEVPFTPVWVSREPPKKDADSIASEPSPSTSPRSPKAVDDKTDKNVDDAPVGSDATDSRGEPTAQSVENLTFPAVVEPKEATIVFDHVSVRFVRAARKFLSFKKELRRKKTFWALRDVSFTVFEGETLGVIGRNGSGKSTLSMICSGVLVPDSGRVLINGKAQLLALGVGFKNELSGRDNVFICGSLLGLSKKQIQDRMDDIEAFAELGEFMEEPVRTYSSGMRSRLGFAVATAVQPDILILDEIMATGDKAFQDKAMRRMREMRGLARSVIVVSHNPAQLRKLATRVLWLDKGRMIMLGDPGEVLNAYDNFCQNPAKWMEHHPELAAPVAVEEIAHG